MAEITIQELEKAAGNIERISAFIGERRDWIVGDGGEEQATAIKGSVKALAKKLVDLSGVEPDPDFMIKLPPKLEPSAKISAARLSKFLAFLDQLRNWLSSENGTELPEDSDAAVQAIHGSLTLVIAAVESLLAPTVAEEPPPPKPEDLVGEIDDSPVLEVDVNAKLILEDHELKPLTQTFQGVTELTVNAKKTLEDFLAEQNVTIEGHDLRRLHDKLLKWIEGIPINQVLVVKLSGLSGKPNVYSSYQPKGGIPVNEEEDV
jgi:hypothetical protein